MATVVCSEKTAPTTTVKEDPVIVPVCCSIFKKIVVVQSIARRFLLVDSISIRSSFSV